MCSWGDIAVGEIRPSFIHPTKSAVLGLVAGALGIRRDEEEKHRQFTETFGFAVLIETAGMPLSDYHTAQVPSGDAIYCTRRNELAEDGYNLNTILSTRDYRVDAIYTVALWEYQKSEWDLNNIAKALIQPVFVPYLGRKSCPVALPFEPQVVEAVSIKEAIGRSQFLDYKQLGINPSNQRMLFWDEYGEAGVAHQHIFERRDMTLSRERWQFDVRRERHTAWTE